MTPNTDLKHFDKYRADFKPYGLTCEMWEPYLMERFDRHNEIGELGSGQLQNPPALPC